MLIEHVSSFINQHRLIHDSQTIVVGLSGGPDSVFLLHLLADWHRTGRIRLVAAHLDHEWRTDSGCDADFCRRLCEQLKVSFEAARASELDFTPQNTGSQEDAGRQLRRYFLAQVARKHNATSIALAHHADDQHETFLMRLLRGATPSGLCAMRPRTGSYIRPLLATHKHEIMAYLDEHKITYLTDPSNESPAFLRNRIRHQVIPALRACDKRFDMNCAKAIGHLQSTEKFLHRLTENTWQQIARHTGCQWLVDLSRFRSLDPFMQRRVLLHWLCSERVSFCPSTGFLNELLRFLGQNASGTHTVAPHWQLSKKKGRAFFTHTPNS